MKRLSEEMDINKVYFNELSEEEVEKDLEDNKKEALDEIEDAAEKVEEINDPKGVETPEEVEIKPLTEKLILSEELEEDEYFDLVSELFQAMQKVCRKWARYTFVDYEDFERAISEASEHLIEIEPELWESYNKKKAEETPLAEDFKLISPLSSYKPWSGAVDTWEKIEEAGKIEELDSLLEEIYPEGLDETELNDLLWFEPEWILESLGLDEENFENDED